LANHLQVLYAFHHSRVQHPGIVSRRQQDSNGLQNPDHLQIWASLNARSVSMCR